MTLGGGPRILVVEDEAQLRFALRRYLESNGYNVREAPDGATALRDHDLFRPDVVLLDLMLPDIGGVEICSAIRASHHTPIIVVSAVSEESIKVKALDAGADDYLTKPFGMEELLARIRVALRHAGGVGSGQSVINVGDLSIDLENRIVSIAGAEVHLTPTEYALLRYMAGNAGKVLTHSMILREVWGAVYKDTSVLRSAINQLRLKLGDDDGQHRLIRNEPRIGYRLMVTETTPGKP